MIVVLAQALAGPPFCGESLEWSVRYLGIEAGQVKVETKILKEGTVHIEVNATSAPWYAVFYNVEDNLISHWAGDRSLYHETRFREGRFWQDQKMHLDADPIRVERSQFINNQWQSWTNTYPQFKHLEDPVSVLYQLRQRLPEKQTTLYAFSGKNKTALYVRPTKKLAINHPLLGEVEAQQYHLFSSHRGEVEQRGNMHMAFTTDERRVPLYATLRSNIGTIHADLTQAMFSSCEM